MLSPDYVKPPLMSKICQSDAQMPNCRRAHPKNFKNDDNLSTQAIRQFRGGRETSALKGANL